MSERKLKSLSKTIMTVFLSFSVPLFILLLIFDIYTIQKQNGKTVSAYENILDLQKKNMENTLDKMQVLVLNTVFNNLDFQSICYSDSLFDTYSHAYNVLLNLRVSFSTNSLIGVFAIFNKANGYYQPAYGRSYSIEDENKIKAFVLNSALNIPKANQSEWIPCRLSDHTVLFRIIGFGNSVCAAMVDPSPVNPSENADGSFVFYSSKKNDPYTELQRIRDTGIRLNSSKNQQIITGVRQRYLLLKEPFANTDMQIVFAVPYHGILPQLDLIQIFLICSSIAVILVAPFGLLILNWKLFHPIAEITQVIKQFKGGNFSMRASENSTIEELKQFSHTFNTMLDQIEQLKIESYEHMLKKQKAQLQYLQLQIRPHFYLNCLKIMYALAEKKQHQKIQEMILALSEYLRYIVQDNFQLIPLSSELHSVENYMKLQQIGAVYSPSLRLKVSSEVTELSVPPQSLLCFVENSIKHFANAEQSLVIQIKVSTLQSEKECYLNLTVSDNGGGFSEEALTKLNGYPRESEYGSHIGIKNIQNRLTLLYQGKASLSFSNKGSGGCVDLFIPIENHVRSD